MQQDVKPARVVAATRPLKPGVLREGRYLRAINRGQVQPPCLGLQSYLSRVVLTMIAAEGTPSDPVVTGVASQAKAALGS